MYICPVCNKEFNTDERVAKHFLQCWKEEHPYHQSKPAPRGEDIHTRKINDDMINFFNSFQKE